MTTRDPGRRRRHCFSLPEGSWAELAAAARSWGQTPRALLVEAAAEIVRRHDLWLEGQGGWERAKQPGEYLTKDEYRRRARARDLDRGADRAEVTAGLPLHLPDGEAPDELRPIRRLARITRLDEPVLDPGGLRSGPDEAPQDGLQKHLDPSSDPDLDDEELA